MRCHAVAIDVRLFVQAYICPDQDYYVLVEQSVCDVRVYVYLSIR